MKPIQFQEVLESFFVSKFGMYIVEKQVLPTNFQKLLQSVIDDSISEYEVSLWFDYPENIPENDNDYLCYHSNGGIFIRTYTSTGWFGELTSGATVIKFRKMPKYMPFEILKNHIKPMLPHTEATLMGNFKPDAE